MSGYLVDVEPDRTGVRSLLEDGNVSEINTNSMLDRRVQATVFLSKRLRTRSSPKAQKAKVLYPLA